MRFKIFPLYCITSPTGDDLTDYENGLYAFTDIIIDDVEFNLNDDIVVVINSTGRLTNLTISNTKLNHLYNVSSYCKCSVPSHKECDVHK